MDSRLSTILQHLTHNEIQFPTTARLWHFVCILKPKLPSLYPLFWPQAFGLQCLANSFTFDDQAPFQLDRAQITDGLTTRFTNFPHHLFPLNFLSFKQMQHLHLRYMFVSVQKYNFLCVYVLYQTSAHFLTKLRWGWRIFSRKWA